MLGFSITQEVCQLKIYSPDPCSGDSDWGVRMGCQGVNCPHHFCSVCSALCCSAAPASQMPATPLCYLSHSSTLSSYHSRHLARWLKCIGLGVTFKCQDTSSRINYKLPLRKRNSSLQRLGTSWIEARGTFWVRACTRRGENSG